MIRSKLILLFYFISTALFAQQNMTQQLFTDADGSATIGYWLYKPGAVSSDTPLIVYLHGGSGKGDNLESLLDSDGFPLYLADGYLGDVDAVVIIPQLSADKKGWSDIASTLRDLIVEVCNTQGLTSHHINLTGHSMGGTGTWALALRYPQLFDKIAPMSGSIEANQENASALAPIKVWAAVGSDDTIVDPQKSADMISLLKENGADAKLTVFSGAGHFDVPALAYKDSSSGVMAWLMNHGDTDAIKPIKSHFTDSRQLYDIIGRRIPANARGLVVSQGQLFFRQ